MKHGFLLFLLCCSAVLSCHKDEWNETLHGTWQMIRVTDNATGAETTKPSSIEGEIDITFNPQSATAGTFSGQTTVNDFEGNFTLERNDSLSVNEFGMSKVAETSWGNSFIDNFREAQTYSFRNSDTLNIKSAEKTLTFERE